MLSVAETTTYKIYSSLSALVCSNRDSRFGDKVRAKKGKSKKRPRESFTSRLYFNAFDGDLSRFLLIHTGVAIDVR